VELLLRRIRESMAERELQLELSEEAKDLLVDKGWDPAMGARPLRRAIQRYVEDPLADFVLRSQVPSGSTVQVDWPIGEDGEAPPDGEVKLTVIEPAPKPTPVAVGAGEGAEGGEEPGPEEPAGTEEPTATE
jgi:ATP-dependent Clp protease ATP-binding subunit ClpC